MTKEKQPKIWMVRAGRGAFMLDTFLKEGIIAIGWNEIGKIPAKTEFKTQREMEDKAFPDRSVGNKGQGARQI